MSTPTEERPKTSGEHAGLKVIKVSPRQVQAARVAIEARKLLGRPIPPGLKRIAEAKRAS